MLGYSYKFKAIQLLLITLCISLICVQFYKLALLRKQVRVISLYFNSAYIKWYSRNIEDDSPISSSDQSEFNLHQVPNYDHQSETRSTNIGRYIYMITPTYRRPTRKADLTRLAQTLMHVTKFHWLLIEDGDRTDKMVEHLLNRLKLSFTYFAVKTNKEKSKKKGAFQRNAAIDWLRSKFQNKQAEAENIIVYFGDDDNTYDLRLFDMMRNVSKVGVWPVAFCGGLNLEKQHSSNSDGSLQGFDVAWNPGRKFAVDMAGFAVNLKYLLDRPKARFALNGGLEESFLRSLTNDSYRHVKVMGSSNQYKTYYDDGPKNEVLVWHTKTEKPNFSMENKYKSKFNRSSDQGWEL